MSNPNENTDAVQTPIFDPFPEPNTMPSGWDLSGLTADREPASALRAEESADTETF